MHIGFLTIESPYDSSGGGGIAAYLRAVIPALLAAGHRVTVLAHSREQRGEVLRRDGVRVVNVRLPNLHWYCSRLPAVGGLVTLPLRQVEWAVAFGRALRDLIRSDPLDVLESAELGALFLARRRAPPVVIRLHGSDFVFRKYSGQPLSCGSRWNHSLEQAVWRVARAITSPSAFQAREVAAEMHWPPGRVRVVPNPIAPDVLAAALQEGAEVGRPQAEPIVLYTGRLAVVKGTVPLLEAARLVEVTNPTARFVLAGPWQMAGEPEKWGLRQSDGKVLESVTWLGHVPWERLLGWYRRATLFVMPSHYETFGISCLEAMAFGLPVVATQAGGLPEVVEDGVTGLLVPPGDGRSLAAAVQRLLEDAPLRRRMGEAGRRRVQELFTADKVVRAMIPIYESVRSRDARSAAT
jgi:glycosyltransferase involved in cell wall biosynthesis